MGIQSALGDINVAIPATVVSYEPSSMRATVKPSIPKRLSNGDILPAPQIVNVPVCFPVADVAGNVAMISLPMKSGDGVLLIFSHRSLENWLSGSTDAPDDPRMFDLSDAFAMPSCNAKSPQADGVNLSIQYGKGSIKIAPSGDVTINAPSTKIIAPQNTIEGDVNITGNLTARGEVSGKGVNLSSHVHGGVQGGPSKTGAPA
ncbi:phage baseplate assembly protein V [Actinobacillus pleuropneumoniae]|uniref:Gp138 family membrane-puncturing spike protein n=1 Tax=Actinobacillus pleuropneumoniae TaxID=715 RepID=UPI0001E4A256|nr:Gp138 family membrane-puncturing spike protein [Actinobacillus pleuropneumoniae]EFM88741.1 hypothetical protein appser4_21160 [Actinobacillus pleuropneumoniae serovar 4 str. M62]UKH41033.1 phage baseplate protein [Actinobacillus pleuropneumoniae serovar 4 str. M62]SQF64564.1 phage baseplate assembly protein V [Actinobacillus pleuropneumoniae]